MRPVVLLTQFAVVAMFAWNATAQDELLEQAAQLDSEQKCAAAEALYQRALASAPSSPVVLNNLGNHYLSCDSPGEAQSIFERLVKMKPNHVNANLQLARLAVQRNEGSKALSRLAVIDARSAADPEVALVRAEALSQSGKRAAAEVVIHQIGAAGNDPRVLFALGMVCARTGFYPAAENAFSRVLIQVPNDFDLLYNFALAAAHCGHLDKARSAFESALKAKPSDVDTLYELGRVETSAGDYNRAVYLLAQASGSTPVRPDISLALARAAQSGGFYGDSVLAYDRYLAVRPDDEMVKRDRALVAGFTRSGQSEALAYLELYVGKHPADAIGVYDLAQLSYRANRATALAEVSKAIELDAHFEPAFLLRAWLLNKSGRYQESLRDAETAAKLNTRDARAFDLVGLDRLELGEAVAAEKPLRAAVSLSPAEADFLFHLGRCLLEQNRRDEARPILAEFQKMREQWTPTPREEPGVIESATLSPHELARRVSNDYREAVRANPNELALRLNLARALVASGETDEALAAFRQLLDMQPPAALSREAGTALLEEDRYELACSFLKRSVAEFPAANLDLAAALYFQGSTDSALAALGLIQDDSQQGDSLALKALIARAQGNRAGALPLLEAIGNRSLANSQIAAEAAVLLSELGDSAKALSLVERTRRNSPDDPRLGLTRSILLSRLKRPVDAEAAIKGVETRWPGWDRPYAAEALMLEESGRTADARVRFEIGAALGPADPVIRCLRGHFTNDSPGQGCSCGAGPWRLLMKGCF